MIDTIEKALNPASLVAFFLGFGILRYPLNQPRYCLSIFYILIVWSAYAYALYYTIILFSERVFYSSITNFLVAGNLFTVVISLIITICEHKKYWQYIKKLDYVDDTLEELGIPKEYHKMRSLTKQALITWFLMTCGTWIFDSLLLMIIHDDTRAILASSVLNYSIHINGITDITFILLLRYIEVRLDKINGHIEQLSETEEFGLRCREGKKSIVVNSYYIRNAKNRKHILWIVIHLHLELCQIARNINDFFGIQITLQMISYFVLINGLVYYDYYTILHLKELHKTNKTLIVFLCCNITWIIVVLMKFISLNHICESVSAKAQKTKDIIYKLATLICFAKIREEIYQFVLQISLRPLKFSGWDLFYLDYSFIRKFFVWTVTITVFMTQMDIKLTWLKNSDKYNITYHNKY